MLSLSQLSPSRSGGGYGKIGLVQEPSSKSGDPLGLAVVTTYVKWSRGGYDRRCLAVVAVGFNRERALHTLRFVGGCGFVGAAALSGLDCCGFSGAVGRWFFGWWVAGCGL
uniref:Uncharacterized protein n=1 Tax=Fagus sylvatica TaxID=28930 RepID=A0A2N9F0A0_FAGSY